jgi:outer membrane protein assembly factor BamA
MNNFYAGVKSELVYDNSINVGMNIIEGTRGKISFTHWQGLNDANNSFSQVAIDVRHYQKIYKEITFAVRGFAGSFFGNSPKEYLLGGMDNWAFNETRYNGTTATREQNPLGVTTVNQDILFVEFVTNLRGFDYATLFGNNALLLNAEFRLPIIRALSDGPISSNFFKNLQLIAFYDIGTSWSGKPPFTEGTSVSLERFKSGPFQIDVKNYLNPWLYSYGVGMRSVMLGYYMKVDVAWPVENYEVGNASWMVTLGFDF